MTEIPPVDPNARKEFIVTGLVGSNQWLYLNNARFHMIVQTLAEVVMDMVDRSAKSCKEDVSYLQDMRRTSGPK
jgi:hypothetical protein